MGLLGFPVCEALIRLVEESLPTLMSEILFKILFYHTVQSLIPREGSWSVR